MRTHSRLIVAYVAVLFCTFVFLTLTNYVYAQEEESTTTTKTINQPVTQALKPISVSPVVSNEKAKRRDIIKKELVVTNNTKERVDLYITVENIDPISGAVEFTQAPVSDLSLSLANWIEITRGVIELGAGESRKIPYLIHVNLTAKPGSYFARLRFTDGAQRAIAEAKDDEASLMLNVEVLDDAKEHLQLGNFKTTDSVVVNNEVDFTYLIENIGNRTIEPRGSIRIFNRKGEEVGSVPINAEGLEITPENKKQLAAAWSSAGRFGKYKAFLDLEYGENQFANVQDTLYFWVFPWKEILAALAGVLVLAVIGTFVIHMRAVARPQIAYQTALRGESQQPFSTSRFTAQRSNYVPRQGTTKTVLNNQHINRATHVHIVDEVKKTPSHSGNTVSLAPLSKNSVATHNSTVVLQKRH